MNVWQRSTSTSVSTNIYSTVDRWKTSVGGLGVFTISRSTDVPSGQGFGYSTKWDCTTADASPATGDFLIMQQILEGQNLQHLLKGTSSAKKVTLSFWVKSNKTGTYIANLYDNDNDRDICKSYTISSSNTWEKKELTFDGDTTGVFDNDNNASLYLQMWLGAGSTYSSGTLATSWATRVQANRAVGQVNLADSTSNEFYITGCQLEVGSTASGFEFEPYATTQNKCYRYYFRMEHDNYYNVTAGYQQFLNGFIGTFNTGTSIGAAKVAPVEMRSDNITFGYSNISHFDIEPFDQAPNAITLQSTSRWGIALTFGSPTSRTQGLSGIVGLDVAGSYYEFDDEL
jgi:hypothetical protein